MLENRVVFVDTPWVRLRLNYLFSERYTYFAQEVYLLSGMKYISFEKLIVFLRAHLYGCLSRKLTAVRATSLTL